MTEGYELLDSGEGQKLERFGPYTLVRPAAAAVWEKQHPHLWDRCDAHFSREEKNHWTYKKKLPSSWNITVSGVTMKISPTDFGHLGIFPEQMSQWQWMRALIEKKKSSYPNKIRVLNLFAYSGGATCACSQAGAEVFHLDASKGMVTWARENAALNKLEKAPLHWVIEDALKFCSREMKRQHTYDALILDPPSFGRGAKGEVFKIEDTICSLLKLLRSLLSPTPLFILLSSHTPGFTPQALHNLLQGVFFKNDNMIHTGCIEAGEMLLDNVLPLPSGTYVRWYSTT